MHYLQIIDNTEDKLQIIHKTEDYLLIYIDINNTHIFYLN